MNSHFDPKSNAAEIDGYPSKFALGGSLLERYFGQPERTQKIKMIVVVPMILISKFLGHVWLMKAEDHYGVQP